MKHWNQMKAAAMAALMTAACLPANVLPVVAENVGETWIVSEPVKSVYEIGEELDLTGATAVASGVTDTGISWTTGEQSVENDFYFNLDTSEFDNTKPGTYAIYVSSIAKWLPTSFTVTVVDPCDVTEYTECNTQENEQDEEIIIEVVKRPTNWNFYYPGQKLDFEGGIIHASGTCKDGRTWDNGELPFEAYSIDTSEYDANNTKPGYYNIYITVEGLTRSETLAYPVCVVEDDMDLTDQSGSIIPRETIRTEETADSTESLQGTTDPYEDTQDTTSPFGDTQLTTLPPTEFSTSLDEEIFFSVVKRPDNWNCYYPGQELNFEGGLIASAGHYKDGRSWDNGNQPFEFYQIDASEFDNTKPGTYNIYITVEGISRSETLVYPVTVVEDNIDLTDPYGQIVPRETVNIEGTTDPYEDIQETTLPLPTETEPEHISFYITQMPDKTEYQIGEELDLTGGVAFACGSIPGQIDWDAFYQPFDHYEVDDHEFDSSVPGTYNIYLTCKGVTRSETISFEVTVAGGKTETATTPTETNAPAARKVRGDVNGDGGRNIMDVVITNKFIAGVRKLTKDEEKAADVNRDNKTDAADSLFNLKLILGMEKADD